MRDSDDLPCEITTLFSDPRRSSSVTEPSIKSQLIYNPYDTLNLLF